MTEIESAYDTIITNWLLMYMNDSECRVFAKKCLNWLKDGGYMFVRESCLHQSGNLARNFNPTYYRNAEYYTQLFEETKEAQFIFKIVKHENIKCYQKIKNNNNQYFWLLQKVNCN